MKNIILLAATLFLTSFAIKAQSVADKINVKGPLEFNKTSFNLAWAEHPRDNYFVQEYLPAGENFEKFNQMLSIHAFKIDMTPKLAMASKTNELTERKKTDPVCMFDVAANKDETEYMISCILSDAKGETMNSVEFILYRYKQIINKKKEKILVIYSYSKRGYGDDITSFMESLKTDKQIFFKEMIGTEIPEIKI